MAARYVRIGQYPDYRDEIRGNLLEILASTANPGTYAAPEDVAGCTLEMGDDGLWTGATVGTLTQARAAALVAAGVMASVKVGVPAQVDGVQYTWQGAAVGWVTGPSSIRSPTSAASLGSEQLSTTWSLGAGWAGTFAAGFTHTAGNTATLTEATTYTPGGLYTVAWAITGRTAGSVTIAVGGISQGSVTATGSIGPQFTATTGIVVTPTTDFNGTITLSVKNIIAQPATTTWLDAAGNTALEIRSVDASRQATAIGQNAGLNNTTGSQWTALGQGAGANNTTGSWWTALGQGAGASNTTGSQWTALGQGAGANNTTGSWWTALGQGAGASNTTGSQWTAIGKNAGLNNTTGNQWTAIGQAAGQSNTTGNSWTALGFGAGLNNTTGNSWTAIGTGAGRNQLGSNWLAIDGYGDRGSAANELANTPIIGTLAATAAAQTLSLNAVTTIYNANEQQSTLSTSQTLSATCTGNQLISAGSLSIALPTGVAAGFEVKFLSHYAFTLTYGSAVIYYGSATGAASVSIPATNAITLAVFDGASWNVR